MSTGHWLRRLSSSLSSAYLFRFIRLGRPRRRSRRLHAQLSDGDLRNQDNIDGHRLHVGHSLRDRLGSLDIWSLQTQSNERQERTL
jgi:hypothetical protein